MTAALHQSAATAPALRRLDQNLPRIDMRAPTLIARQRQLQVEASSPTAFADLAREKHVALAAIRDEAERIVAKAHEEADILIASARAEAAEIIAIAVEDARRQVVSIVGETVKRTGALIKPVADYCPPARILVSEIIERVAKRHSVSIRTITGDRREQWIVSIRYEAIAEAYQLRPDLSLGALGRCFGKRDHSTILYAVRRMGVYRGVKA